MTMHSFSPPLSSLPPPLPGWWMVMVEDEQGYAPASYLETVNGGGNDTSHQDDDEGKGEGDRCVW